MTTKTATKPRPSARGEAPTKARLMMAAPELALAMRKALLVTPKNGTIPVLNMVRVDVIDGEATFTATDLERTLTFKAPARGEGSMLLPAAAIAKRFAEIAREVVFTIEGEKIAARTQQASYQFDTLPVSDFPTLKPGTPVASFSASTDKIGWAFQQCAPAMSDDPTRLYAHGVFITFDKFDGKKCVRFVALDGHRMTVCGLPEAKPLVAGTNLSTLKCIVPQLTVEAINRLIAALAPDANDDLPGTISVRQLSNVVIIEGPDFHLTSKMIDLSFPDYQRVMPEPTQDRAIVNAEYLLQTARRVAIAESSRGVTLQLDKAKGGIIVSVGSKKEVVTASHIECGAKSEPQRVSLEYLVDACELIGMENEQRIALAPSNPLLFTDPDTPDFIHVVMGMLSEPRTRKPASVNSVQQADPASPSTPAKTPSKKAPGAPGKPLAGAPGTIPARAPSKAPASPGKQAPRAPASKAPKQPQAAA